MIPALWPEENSKLSSGHWLNGTSHVCTSVFSIHVTKRLSSWNHSLVQNPRWNCEWKTIHAYYKGLQSFQKLPVDYRDFHIASSAFRSKNRPSAHLQGWSSFGQSRPNHLLGEKLVIPKTRKHPLFLASEAWSCHLRNVPKEAILVGACSTGSWWNVLLLLRRKVL